MRRLKQPSKAILSELALGVEEIIDEFEWQGFSIPEAHDAPGGQQELLFDQLRNVPEPDDNGEPGDEDEDDDNGEADQGADYEPARDFDREDIEVGIDQLITRMIKKKFIAEAKVGRQPTLERVFSAFYDQSNPILRLVDSFAEHIHGYFGVIAQDEMQAAFDDILKIREMIAKDLEAVDA